MLLDASCDERPITHTPYQVKSHTLGEKKILRSASNFRILTKWASLRPNEKCTLALSLNKKEPESKTKWRTQSSDFPFHVQAKSTFSHSCCHYRATIFVNSTAYTKFNVFFSFLFSWLFPSKQIVHVHHLNLTYVFAYRFSEILHDRFDFWARHKHVYY